MKRNILFLILFLVGLTIFAYPIVSNVFASKEHYTIINKHDEEIMKMSEADIADMKAEAETYNEKLINTTVPLEDPFAEETNTTTNTGYFDVLNIGESMGSVEIPKIDVKLPIYHGTGEKVLQRGVGHLSNTSLPVGGIGTHSVLTGHRGLPSAKMFRKLDKLEIGDMFYIKSLGEVMAYEVDHVAIVLPNEVELLAIDEDKEYSTLITCEPYMINTHRMLVRGKRVPYTPEAEAAEQVKENPIEKVSSSMTTWIIVVGLIVLCAVAGYLIYKRKRNKWKSIGKDQS